MSPLTIHVRRLPVLTLAATLVMLAAAVGGPLATHAHENLVESVFVHVPAGAASGARLRVLVALHGVGGNGQAFGGQLIEVADRNDWILVAPTLRYGNWWNTDELVSEDTAFARWLVDYLDHLERDRGLAIHEQVLLFGFSRGAGAVGRFALLHPERVLAEAALSSGTYTLPLAKDGRGRTLAYPFGVADLAAHGGRAADAHAFASVRWFVGVGSADNQPKDVPQNWSPYIGTSRLERARALSSALRSIGADVTLRVFPETAHILTAEMRSESLSFLHNAEPLRSQAPKASPTKLSVTVTPTPTPTPLGEPTVTPTLTPTPTPTPPGEPGVTPTPTHTPSGGLAVAPTYTASGRAASITPTPAAHEASTAEAASRRPVGAEPAATPQLPASERPTELAEATPPSSPGTESSPVAAEPAQDPAPPAATEVDTPPEP